MPFVYNALMRELDFYRNDRDNAVPSAVHLVSGKLEIYENSAFKISSSTPVIVSDATAGMPELYQAAFSRELEIYSPKVRNPNAHITVVGGSDWTRGELEHRLGKQLKDRATRKAEYAEDVTGAKFYLHDIPTNPNLYDDNKLLKEYEDSIYSLVERHSSILVVVHKKVRDILEDIFRYKYPIAAEKISWGHYGSLRGTNKFKACSAVVLLGVPRVPYDVVWRKIQAWANLLRIESPIPYRFIYKPKPYDGHFKGHTYRTFDNPFAQRFVDTVEEGECIQSMERIRPHSTDDEKYIYIFASRPMGNYITNITTKNNVLNLYRGDSSLNRVRTYIEKTYADIGKFPSTRETMTALRVGYKVYKEALDLTKEKLQSTISTSTKKES
jgi:hypothetical protein